MELLCAEAQKAVFPGTTFRPEAVGLSGKPEYGDYQNNAALALFKEVKGGPGAPTSPRECAERLMAKMSELNQPKGLLGAMEVSGAGFINIRLCKEVIVRRVREVAVIGTRPPIVKTCRAVVDFSSPNVAKEMHVGHLRSTIIGDAVCRFLEFVGYEVERINHIGDWGTQFGMLIALMKEKHPNFTEEAVPIASLEAFYREAKKRFGDDEAFKEEAHKNVVALQSGDETCHKAWTLICQASRAEFEKVYDRLGVRLREMGESYYNPYIPGVVDALEKMGLVVPMDGAKIIPTPEGKGHDFPLIVVKSDGGFGYDSTDMTAVWYRVCEMQADWVIYVVDSGQGPHFELIFDAAKRAGWLRYGGEGGGALQGLACHPMRAARDPGRKRGCSTSTLASSAARTASASARARATPCVWWTCSTRP